MDIHAYLKALGQYLKINGLCLDKHQVCRIVLGDGFDVYIEPGMEPYTIHFYAILGSLPLSNREKLYEVILVNNLFGKHTEGMQICCDVQAQEVLLYYRYEQQQMNSEYFICIFKKFTEQFKKQSAWLKQRVFNASEPSKTTATLINPSLLV